MSDYFDRIERHLLDAVERNASTSRLRWRLVDGAGHWWSRRMLNTSTVLAAVLVVVSVSVAGVFLTSVHSARRPSSGTVSADQACGAKAAQRLSRGAPPESVLSVLGVLRRPQAPTDRLPARFAPRVLGGGSTLIPPPPAAVLRLDGLPHTARIASGSLYAYSRYVRRARLFAGGSDYLIPMAGAVDRAGPGRCSHPYFAGVELHELRGGAGFGGCCSDVSEILAGRASSESGEGGRTFLTFLVPDRVADVTVYFTAGQGPRTTIRTKPVGNVVSVILPISSLTETTFRVRSVWHAASGRIINPVR
jgi:hypothetical protein